MLIAALSAGDKLSIGGITTLLGLGMTFIVLALLIGFIFLMEKGLKSLTSFLGTRKTSKNIVSSQPVQIVKESEAVSEENSKPVIDEKTMTAIVKAVALFAEYDDKDKKPHNNIVIKSVTEIE